MFISSPSYQNTGRINFILDEFAQLPKLSGVTQALDIGRSKGVSVLIGVQSLKQLRDIYGERSESFRSLIGNHIFAQMSPGIDAEDASRFLGNQIIRQKQFSTSKQSDSGISTSVQWIEKERPLMTTDEFSTFLGPDKKGVWGVYTGLGLDCYILHFPFRQITPFRKSFIPAQPQDHKEETDVSKQANKPFNELLQKHNKN